MHKSILLFSAELTTHPVTMETIGPYGHNFSEKNSFKTYAIVFEISKKIVQPIFMLLYG